MSKEQRNQMKEFPVAKSGKNGVTKQNTKC